MTGWMVDLARDVRYGARVLRRAPGFALVAIMSLALGIGGASAVFTLVNAIILRSLPIPQPNELYVAEKHQATDVSTRFSWPAFEQARDSLRGRAELAAWTTRAMLVDSDKIIAAARGLLTGRAPVPRHWRYPGLREPAVPSRAAPPATAAAPAPVQRPAAVPPTAAAAPSSGAAAGGGEPITMPFGDLTISEGKIVRWTKADGDAVKAGELVAEIETDKSVVEIEAPAAGRLKIEQHPGTVVPMGGRIGVVN